MLDAALREPLPVVRGGDIRQQPINLWIVRIREFFSKSPSRQVSRRLVTTLVLPGLSSYSSFRRLWMCSHGVEDADCTSVTGYTAWRSVALYRHCRRVVTTGHRGRCVEIRGSRSSWKRVPLNIAACFCVWPSKICKEIRCTVRLVRCACVVLDRLVQLITCLGEMCWHNVAEASQNGSQGFCSCSCACWRSRRIYVAAAEKRKWKVRKEA